MSIPVLFLNPSLGGDKLAPWYWSQLHSWTILRATEASQCWPGFVSLVKAGTGRNGVMNCLHSMDRWSESLLNLSRDDFCNPRVCVRDDHLRFKGEVNFPLHRSFSMLIQPFENHSSHLLWDSKSSVSLHKHMPLLFFFKNTSDGSWVIFKKSWRLN